jgi:hypothetical protein
MALIDIINNTEGGGEGDGTTTAIAGGVNATLLRDGMRAGRRSNDGSTTATKLEESTPHQVMIDGPARAVSWSFSMRGRVSVFFES